MKTKWRFILSVVCGMLLLLNEAGAQAPGWAWAKRAGGSSYDEAYAVTADVSGNIYTTGYFRSQSVTFGTITLNNTSLNYNDIFIVKSDSSGNVIWAKSAGGANDDVAYSVTTDALGNVYIAGGFNSASLAFGTTTLNSAGGFDMFVAKYDSAGNPLWAASAGGTGNNDGAYAAIADDSGNVYVAGGFNSPSFAVGLTTLSTAGGFDVFVAEYDASGNPLWAKSAGGMYDDAAQALAADTAGNIYVTGYYKSAVISFDTSILNNASSNQADMFIARYDGSGNVSWAKSAGGSFDDRGLGITTDPSGNSYATGYFSDSTITFQSTTLHNSGSTGLADLFLVKYDASGNVMWARQAGGTSFDYGQALTADASGNIFLSGYFKSPVITFGSMILNNAYAGYTDVFVVKYDAASGTPLWVKRAGGHNYDEAYAITTDAAGNSYVAGHFYSASALFDSDTLNNSGLADIFIAKLNGQTLTEAIDPEKKNAAAVTVFPNPVKNEFTITASSGIFRVQVISANGQLIKTVALNGQNTFAAELSENGMYFIRVTTGGETITQKMIVSGN